LTNRGFWDQGQGSAPEASSLEPLRPVDWLQRGLLPQELVQVRLDVGWHAAARAGMYSYEAYVPDTKELLGMRVRPTAHYPSLQIFLDVVTGAQRHVLMSLFDPDPF
jgi:hypothetical protein